MRKLFGYGLNSGEYGTGTQKDINELCKEIGTTVYRQELADFSDAEWSVCGGCTLADGMYIIKEGILLASETGIEIISTLKLCA
ncbi:hypothetical protein LL033_11845 [Clostridium estertheticum]|uniref:hypothetical protein n=1 Tax=Clostridium estertheticum TaxID=238834 RepID=UPI001C0BBF14|nr:hypothetical protein [Clostridium estertheticum]MBU3215844.1 hypothetical protein [Clostridium estertheticum]WAG57799.1 hypothetical protein LL033_11845 [Clostridium estertheticum]